MWNPWKLFMNKDDVDQSFSSLISRGIRIEENAMVGSEALRIDGNIRMDRICMDEAIIVSNTAQINVEYLQAKRIIIDGVVDGMVRADSVYLLEHAMLRGDIHAKELSIERGAKFYGRNFVVDESMVSVEEANQEFNFQPITNS